MQLFRHEALRVCVLAIALATIMTGVAWTIMGRSAVSSARIAHVTANMDERTIERIVSATVTRVNPSSRTSSSLSSSQQQLRQLSDRDAYLPTVTMVILVRNSGSFLSTYLWMLTRQDYPKSLISVYIRTNDNTDDTVDILEQFVKDYRSEYARMLLNSSSVDWTAMGMTPPSISTLVSTSSLPTVVNGAAVNGGADDFNANAALNFNGKWSEKKLRVMGMLRQNTLDQAWAWQTDCFFVADADNFVIQSALRSMTSLRLPVVSPMLILPNRNGSAYLWTSHHNDYRLVGAAKRLFFQQHKNDGDMRWRRLRGVIQVPLVQCTFLLWLDPRLKNRITYLAPQAAPHPMSDITPGEFEFQILAESMRRAGVKMYVDNTYEWGYAVYHNEHLSTMKREILALEAKYEALKHAPYERYST